MLAGALREALLVPRLGEQAAHQVGTLLVVAAILLVVGLLVRWIDPALDGRRLLLVGGLWALLTVLFEFGFGRRVVGHSWDRLLHDYDVTAGRIWILVPAALLLGPWILGRLRSESG